MIKVDKIDFGVGKINGIFSFISPSSHSHKTWKHLNPCEEWKTYVSIHGIGYCRHYAFARYRKFKKEIDALSDMENWNGKLIKWVYISNK